MPKRRASVRELKLTGSYRADRHARRRDLELSEGRPARPKWLVEPEARAMWDRLADPLYRSGLCFREDGEALASLCRWWAAWQVGQRMMRRAAREGDPQRYSAATMAAARAWHNCCDLLARFGLTPKDRALLKLEKPQAETKDEKELRYFGGSA